MDAPDTMDARAREAAEACRTLLGEDTVGWEDPGGQRRKSTRLFLDGRSVIATRRGSRARAHLETEVLRRLRAAGAPVPDVLAFDGRWLLQEDMPGERLSRVLRQATKAEAFALQDTAMESLLHVHDAARTEGLGALCFPIGNGPEWIAGLLRTPGRLGAFLGVPAPSLDLAAVERVLVRDPVSFVKWDARPPNAVAHGDDPIAWFDWEHCGRRNRLDDLVWFFGDESIVDRPGDETTLLNRWVPRFDEGGYPAGPAQYMMTMGVLHCVERLAIRIGNVGRERRPDDWRSALAAGRIGPLPAPALRAARRGARWAERSRPLRPLADWLRTIRERFAPA